MSCLVFLFVVLADFSLTFRKLNNYFRHTQAHIAELRRNYVASSQKILSNYTSRMVSRKILRKEILHAHQFFLFSITFRNKLLLNFGEEMENLREILSQRIGQVTVRRIAAACETNSGDGTTLASQLLSIALSDEDRAAYNALWILTHLSPADGEILRRHRDRLIDRALRVSHTGCRRLLLNLINRHPADPEDLRTDYLDFCLSRINSTEPYGIRALCLMQAYD